MIKRYLSVKNPLLFFILIAVLPAAVLDFLYFISTSVDIPFQTSFFFMDNLIKFYNGTLTFHDITVPYGEHRVIICNIIFLINATLFHLDTRIEHYIFYFVYICTGIIFVNFLYQKCKYISLSNRWSFYTVITSALIIGALNFTLTQHYDTGMGVQVIIGLLSSICFMISANKILTVDLNIKHISVFIITSFLTFTIFGSGYTYDAALAMTLCVGLRCLANRRIDSQSMIVFSITILGGLLYLKMPYAYPVAGTEGLSLRLLSMISSPGKTINFFLVSFGASVIGQRPFSDSMSSLDLYKILGALILIIYIVSIFLANKYRSLIKSYIPELLIYYSFFNIAMVCIGRWNYMDAAGDWGVSAWYIYHNKLGVIGAISIFCLVVINIIETRSSSSSSQIFAAFALPLFVIILAPLIWIESHIIEIIPAIRNFTERTVHYAYFPEDTPTDSSGITPFLWNLPELKKYLEVMRVHQIGPFKPPAHSPDDSGDNVTISGDIYVDGWAGKNVEAILGTGKKGELFITSFAPVSLFPEGNGFRVTMNGNEIYRGLSEPGALTAHVINVPPNSRVGIKIVADKTMSPQGANINGDLRNLSFKIGDFFAR